MAGISTHVLDTALGKPAAGMTVVLEQLTPSATWIKLAERATDGDGRVSPLVTAGQVRAGVYRVSFRTAAYFDRMDRVTLYPEIVVTFTVEADGSSYHLPLLLTPFGYTTYRGT